MPPRPLPPPRHELATNANLDKNKQNMNGKTITTCLLGCLVPSFTVMTIILFKWIAKYGV